MALYADWLALAEQQRSETEQQKYWEAYFEADRL